MTTKLRILNTLLLCAVVATAVMTLTAAPAFAQVEELLREGDKRYEEGEFRKAAAAYDNAIRKYPGQVPAEAYAQRARIYITMKDFEGGLAFIRNIALKQHPNAAEVMEQEALILWQLGKKGDAIAVAEKVAAARPSAFAAQLLIGEFYANRDAKKTAVAYEAYLEHRPGDVEAQDVLPRARLGFAYLALARIALSDGKSKDANNAYLRAVAQFEVLKRKHGKRPHASVNADNGLCAAYTGLGKYDQAITICEQIVRNPKAIDGNGSTWFNLGKAYLAKKQPGRARTAATEYKKLKPKESRAFILIGDSYFQERNYELALQNYLTAESLLKPSQQRESGELSIKMGITYRRLPWNGSGTNPNLQLAIDKLEAGFKANPGNSEIAIELGSAYLASKSDDKALARVDSMINRKDFKDAAAERRAALLVVSAKALFNLGKVKESRARFETAYSVRPKDVRVRRGLIETIEVQAYQAIKKQDYKTADTLLDEAAAIEQLPAISLNRAVLLIDQGNCDGAQRQLDKLRGVQGYALQYERLMARTYVCADKPNLKKAAEHYAAADKEVKKVQANQVQAEINTEWAPILMKNGANLDEVVGKLEDAVQFAQGSPEILTAAKRNLAVALFRRGWKRLKDGKATEAASDFDRAGREPALLKGNEALAFEFSHALALLDRGDTGEAARMFKSLAGKGNQGAYLKAPYNKVGTAFFSAYANYRGGTPDKRAQAAKEFESLSSGASGAFQQKIRDLLTSSYEYVAYDAWRNGKEGAADKALTAAARSAEGDLKRRITHNRAVLSMSAKQIDTFEGLGGSPPEALVNLGILYDRAGKPKEAYEAWVKASSRGVQAKDLKKWIDAKKRIYGFN